MVPAHAIEVGLMCACDYTALCVFTQKFRDFAQRITDFCPEIAQTIRDFGPDFLRNRPVLRAFRVCVCVCAYFVRGYVCLYICVHIVLHTHASLVYVMNARGYLPYFAHHFVFDVSVQLALLLGRPLCATRDCSII